MNIYSKNVHYLQYTSNTYGNIQSVIISSYTVSDYIIIYSQCLYIFSADKSLLVTLKKIATYKKAN